MGYNLLVICIYIELAILGMMLLVYYYKNEKLKRRLNKKKETLLRIKAKNHDFMIERKGLIEQTYEEIVYLKNELKIIDEEIKNYS